MNRDHPDHSTVKICLNTEESPGDLKRLAVTQTPVKKKWDKTGLKNSQRVK